MSSQTDEDAQTDKGTRAFKTIVDGLDRDDAKLSEIVKKVLLKSKFGALEETVGFLHKLTTERTPSTEEEIMALDESEVIRSVYRMNFFEKTRHPVLNDSQIEYLYQRTVDLWGEAPTEPVGRWAEWTLWVTRHRRQNGIAITDVIVGNREAEDILRSWEERHNAREERRKYHKMMNYGRYNLPEDVPPSLRHLLLGPVFGTKAEVSDIESSLAEDDLTDAELETGDYN
jgi:hypothetical protein